MIYSSPINLDIYLSVFVILDYVTFSTRFFLDEESINQYMELLLLFSMAVVFHVVLMLVLYISLRCISLNYIDVTSLDIVFLK